ncbi:serine/threonine-protein phosphatase 6 regulatory ankyrin repeat subunit B isoform X1 [Gigaspora margarita]|uniref:Serine/threonine-protein phosphatase 6 regulatory ankyrin repeat subunit B isoform X1 n=1 Tax=Gigaspora margarita TaxID=4874 RepID=A0A8H3X2X7_GIGMA|nr:serine/threonine-protein phosphatase 6 regulatory ankyrin repeat subunit B isoform X1 [Gigaspora margarita]
MMLNIIFITTRQENFRKFIKKSKNEVNDVENEANVEITDENNQTALHCAAENGYKKVVETLLINNAKVDATDINGKTPLHCAAENGHITVVETLMKKNAKVDSTDSNGKTALHYAAENGHVTVVEALIENNANVNSTDNDHCTPLFYAAKNDYAKVIETLLINNAKVDATDINGKTSLHHAAENGRITVVETLMEKNAKVDSTDINGKTALHYATENGHVTVVETLIKNHANVNSTDNDHCTPLFYAAKVGHEIIIQILINNDANIEISNKSNKTALDCATENKDLKIVKLLEARTEKNIILNYTLEYFENIKFLLENGADPKYIIDKNYRTPLHWFTFEGNENMVKDLIEKNPNLVNIIDKNEETALYDAIWNGNIKIVEIFLEKGANINAKNANNWNPLDIAAISCQVEVFKLLLKNREDNIQLENFFDQLDYNQLDNYSRFEPTHETITGLVKILQKLENYNNIDFLPFYQIFLKHIEKYMQSLDNNNNEDKEAVGCLYAWAFNKICNFKFRSELYLIIDIKRYLDIIDNDIKLWHDASKQKIISEISNKYKKEFNAKVEEAYKII